MAKLDQLADIFGNTDNPLGSLIGFGLRRRLGVPAGVSLLRGMGRGVGSLRNRMSQRDSSYDSWSEEDSSSPRKIFSDDGDSGNSREVLIRLTSIENILRGMSQLATKSDERDATSVETDRQAQEELHRLAERPDESSISMSPIRVEEEKKSGGLFSSLFSGLTKFAGLIGPGSKLILGLIGLAGVAAAAKLAWDKLFPGTSAVEVVKDAGEAFLGSALHEGMPPVDPDAPITDQVAAAAGDPVRSAVDAVGRDVPLGVVATQSAQQGFNLLRASGLGLRAPWQVGAAGWNAAAPVAGAGIRTAADFLRAASSRTPTRLGVANIRPSNVVPGNFGWTGAAPTPEVPDSVEKKLKQSIWQRLMQSRLMQSRWMPNFSSLTRLRALGKVPGAIGTTLQLGTAAYDASQGNWGQAGTGALAAGLMSARNPLAVVAGLTLSTALTDYKTQDERKLNALGMMAATQGHSIGRLGRGGVGTGMMSDTLGAWLFRGLSALDLGGESFSLASIERQEEEARKWRPGTSNVGRGEKHRFIKTRLMNAGYEGTQAEGIIKNLMDESLLDERAVGDDGTALGIAQWRGSRADNMKAYAAEHPEMSRLEAQVGFLIEELKSTPGGSPEEAPTDFVGMHNWFLKHFEKPAAVNVAGRWIGPSDTGTTARLDNSAAKIGDLNKAVGDLPPTNLPRSRQVPAADANREAESTTSVVAPQTTNNFFADNRSTNIIPAPLNAHNSEIMLWLYRSQHQFT